MSMMGAQQILALLLIGQVAIFAVVALLHSGALKRFLIERRITVHLAASDAHGRKALVHHATPSRLAKILLSDLPEDHHVSIPWMGAMYRLTPSVSFEVFAWLRIGLLTLGATVPVVLFGFIYTGAPFGTLFTVIGVPAVTGLNWWMSRLYIASLSRERQESISLGMPYALDLILICLDSGVSLESAIARVAAELSGSSPRVSEELYRTLLDINVLSSRDQAFQNLGKRIDTTNMRTIVTVLCQSLQYGSSLAESLKEAIQNMKSVELLELEERAGKLPIQLTLPGMIFTLPQVIILLAGPGVVSLLDTLKPA